MTLPNIENFTKLARIKPNGIEIHLTNFCNHACSWCVADEVRQNKWHFPYEKAEKLIRECGEAGVGTIIFSGGGDPFMFKGLEKLLELSHSLGMENMLVTNGYGLNEKNIPIVAKTCHLVRISTDAGNQEAHALIHRPKNPAKDNLDVITKKISMLTKEVKEHNHSAKVMLTFVVIDESIESIPEFLDLAERLEVHEVDFKTNHFWSPQKKNETYEYLRKLVEKSEKRSFHINIEEPKSRVGEKSEELWSTLLVAGIVEANGDLYPCCHRSLQPQWHMGNVLETNFVEAWTGTKRQEILKRSLNEHYVCPTCLDTDFNRRLNQFVSKHGIDLLTKESRLLPI